MTRCGSRFEAWSSCQVGRAPRTFVQAVASFRTSDNAGYSFPSFAFSAAARHIGSEQPKSPYNGVFSGETQIMMLEKGLQSDPIKGTFYTANSST